MEYIIVGFVILLIWGNISRRNNPVNVKTTGSVPTAGDSFNSGCAIVSGVCEPSKTGTVAPVPIHVIIPVDPPPIAIQKKTTIYPDGTLVGLSATGEVDMIQNGKRRWVPDPYTFSAMKLNWSNVQWIDSASFNAIPQGQRFPNILQPAALPKVNPINPVLVTPTAPIRTPIRATPVWCGNGPGWCTAKLNQIASSHCWAAQSTGCAGF